MIQHIVEFRADLHAESVGYAHRLRQYSIRICVVRSVKLIPPRVSDMAQKRGAEGIQIYPGLHASILDPRARVHVGVAQYVGPGKARDPGATVVQLSEYGIRMSRLRAHDPGDSNLLQRFPHDAEIQLPLARTERKLIREIDDTAMSDVVIGVSPKRLVGIPRIDGKASLSGFRR